MICLTRPKIPTKLRDDLVGAILILVPGDRRFKIARVSQTICSDRPEIGKAKLRPVILTYITPKLFVIRVRLYLKFQPARNADHLTGACLQVTKLGEKSDAPFLGHDQHFPIGVVKVAIAHALVKGIDVNRHSELRIRVAISRDRRYAINKIRRFARDWQRISSKLGRCGCNLIKRRRSKKRRHVSSPTVRQSASIWLKRLM